jgi:hypothetical protein
MKISELVVGEFYIIKPTTKKEVFIVDGSSLQLASVSRRQEKNKIYKESLYLYLGQIIERVEKRVDSKTRNVYTYKPHMMQCVKTGELFKINGYYVQTYFVKPKK